jgi:hypothetical protein
MGPYNAGVVVRVYTGSGNMTAYAWPTAFSNFSSLGYKFNGCIFDGLSPATTVAAFSNTSMDFGNYGAFNGGVFGGLSICIHLVAAEYGYGCGAYQRERRGDGAARPVAQRRSFLRIVPGSGSTALRCGWCRGVPQRWCGSTPVRGR